MIFIDLNLCILIDNKIKKTSDKRKLVKIYCKYLLHFLPCYLYLVSVMISEDTLEIKCYKYVSNLIAMKPRQALLPDVIPDFRTK